MFKLSKEQIRVEEQIRAAVFANEAHLLGLDPVALAQMGEGAILRECAYRAGPVGNAAPIGPEAWRRIDDRATTIMRDVLQVFARLQAASSTPVSMGDIMSYFPQVSDSAEVSVSMDGRHPGRSDQALVKYVGTPVPIVSSQVRMGWRQMEVIRKAGSMLDTESIANSQRKVAEKLEDMALNGDASVVVSGNTIYGLRNHPNRNTDTHGFDLNSTATGANWLTTFQKLINALIADNAYGRVTAFVNYSDWVYASINEFVAGYPKTILQRLREIEQIADIVPCSKVPADNVLGIAGLETGNWGSVLTGMPLTTRPKARQNAEDDYVFTIMAAAAPQLRTDYDGRAPFAHLTAT
jgi:uncharacterized linocin/CFP29 family protein